MKCNVCEETELSGCEECGDALEERDFIYCMVFGKHSHRNCMGISKAMVLK